MHDRMTVLLCSLVLLLRLIERVVSHIILPWLPLPHSWIQLNVLQFSKKDQISPPLPVQQLLPSPSACSSSAALTTPPPDVTSSAFGMILWTLDLLTQVERSNATHIQPTKKNGGLSGAQKATQQLQCVANQLLHEHFSKELNTLLTRHQEELEALATCHSKKMEYIEKLQGTSKHYKAKRLGWRMLSYLHTKSIEVNSGMWFISSFLQCPYNAHLQIALVDHE